MRPETKLRKALEKLDNILYDEFGFDDEMPEQDCDCCEHVVKTVSPENRPVFMLLVNLLELLLPRELGECNLTFSNCCTSITINPILDDECLDEETHLTSSEEKGIIDGEPPEGIA